MIFTKWVSLGVLVFASTCWADGKAVCTTGQARVAEKRVSSITSWGQFHSIYKAFQHCDDGAVGEGFSESVSLLLTSQWRSINQFARLAQKDKNFLEFVLKHIDETVPEERLRNIENNAASRCSVPSVSVCLAIRQSVEKLNSAEKKSQAK